MGIVSITIRGEEEFRRKVLSKAKAEGTSLQAVLTACLEEWLEGERKPVQQAPTHPEIPKELRRYIDRLATILSSGDVKSIAAVAANIDLFVDRLRPSGVHGKSPRRREASE